MQSDLSLPSTLSAELSRSDEPGDRGAEQSIDDIFFVLSNGRRRCTLQYLRGLDRPADLRELIAHVAAWEAGADVSETTYAQRKRAYVALRQTHLPKLAEMGFIEYDPDRGTVTTTDRLAVLDSVFADDPEAEPQWSAFYLGFGLLSTLLVAAAWVGLPPFSMLPGLVYAAFFGVLLTGFSLVHFLRGPANENREVSVRQRDSIESE